jgi:predicted ATP-grasp superfamily ATP-dependent carboligase
VPDASVDADGLVDAVLGLVEAHRPRVIVAGADGTIEALRARRDELEERATLALAAEDALALAVDKERTLELAASLDIPVPRTLPLVDAEDVEEAVDQIGLPAVIKPVRSWVADSAGGRRVISSIVTTADEAREAAATNAARGGQLIIQEWVRGRREAISLFAADGRIWARFAQVAQRMFPPLGGSSVVRESIPLPKDLTEFAERLVFAAGLEGYAEVEFRRDTSGRPRLMEINPRLSASVEIAVRAGIDFPLLMFAHASGQPLTPARAHRTGLRMRWLGGDIRWLRATLGQQGRPDIEQAGRAVTTFAFDFLRPASYDYLKLDDPLPALTATVGFAAAAVRRRHVPQSSSQLEMV